MAKYAKALGGNWSAASTWSATSSAGVDNAGQPTAAEDAIFDAGAVAAVVVDTTTCVCKTLTTQAAANILTFTAGQKLAVSGSVTFFAWTGTNVSGTGNLTLHAAGALTMNGKTFPGSLTFDAIVTYTIAGAAVVTGLVTFSAGCVLNYTTAEATDTLTCNGGAYSSGGVGTGSAKLIIGGGTLSTSLATTYFGNDIDLNGTVVIGTSFAFAGLNKTIAFVGGTVDTSTNTSTLTIRNSCILNTPSANMHWYNLTTSASATLTLTSAITVDQNLTSGANNLTIATSNITVGGNLTATGNIVGVGRTITMTGTGTTPTWSGAGRVGCNLTFNAPAGAITINGIVAFDTGTLLYTAIQTPTVSGSTIQIQQSATLNTGAMNLNNITVFEQFNNADTITLASNLNLLGTLSAFNDTVSIVAEKSLTFAGAFNISCANFNCNSTNGNYTINFLHAQTLTVSTRMIVCGNGNYSLIIQSDTAAKTYITYNGTQAACKVFNTIFTWVSNENGSTPIWNWMGGTLSNTTNIFNMTSANVALSTDAPKILTGQTVGTIAGSASGSSNDVFGIM